MTFLTFGAVLFGPALGDVSWDLVLYAVLSLTLCACCLLPLRCLGLRRARQHSLFMGWFGPRGLASIVFALIVLEGSNLPHEHTILLAIYLTVGLSVLLHGITAAPLADRYGRWYAATPARPSLQ